MSFIKTLEEFPHEDKTYVINYCEHDCGRPYVQAYTNGKPYGIRASSSDQLVLKHQNGEEPNLYSELANVIKTDIITGQMAKALTRMKCKDIIISQ